MKKAMMTEWTTYLSSFPTWHTWRRGAEEEAQEGQGQGPDL